MFIQYNDYISKGHALKLSQHEINQVSQPVNNIPYHGVTNINKYVKI